MFDCKKSSVKLNLALFREKVTFFPSNFTFQILTFTVLTKVFSMVRQNCNTSSPLISEIQSSQFFDMLTQLVPCFCLHRSHGRKDTFSKQYKKCRNTNKLLKHGHIKLKGRKI